MKTIWLAVGTAMAAAIFSAPAPAQRANRPIIEHVNVHHGDLDLADKSGAETMLARLEKAATKACGGWPTATMSWNQMSEAKQREHRRCKAAALDSATLKLGASLVRSAWLSKAQTTHHAAKAR
jgi:UrcA family protein